MNKERLEILANVLESERAENHFNMATFFSRNVVSLDEQNTFTWIFPEEGVENKLNECGTTACIAGWAIALFDPKAKKQDMKEYAAELLDIDGFQADELFISHNAMNIETPVQAAKVIRNLIATGEVDIMSGLDPELYMKDEDGYIVQINSSDDYYEDEED